MKRYGNIDINMMTREQREEFLSALILQLKKFKSKSGSEGTAYFVDDKFVVKEYARGTVQNYQINLIFDLYCQEVQYFARQGYLVPEIYSWIKYTPSAGIFSKDKEPKYYILEEQISGRRLYLPSLSECYSFFEDNYSFKKFKKVINNPKENLSLYKEILHNYICDYIYANEFIEAMPESDLDAFIMSIAKMFEEAEYGLPDVHGSNVFMSDGKLKLIDNYMTVKKANNYFISQTVEEFLLARISILFEANKKVNEFASGKTLADIPGFMQIQSLSEKNSLLCEAALEKILKAMKRCLDGKTVENQRVLHTAYQRLSRILDYEKAKDLIHIVNERYL